MKKLAGGRNKSLLNALQNIFGGSTIQAVTLVAAVLIGLDWIGSGLMGLLGASWAGWGSDAVMSADSATFLFGLIVLGGAILFLRRWEASASFAAEQQEVAPGASGTRVLVLLLSYKGDLNESQDRFESLPSQLGPDTDLAAHNEVLGNWRMPLEAIKPHLGPSPEQNRLEDIVVITSGGKKGSASQFQHFRQLLSRMLTPREVRILGLHDFSPGATDDAFDPTGCDFDNVEAVWKHLSVIWESYRQESRRGRRLTEKQILIDITGGTKLTSIAGALFTRELDRRCQYVQVVGDRTSVFMIDVLRTDD
ncbi:hypothetical protein [Thioalkalivibrio sp. AKL10]|uniref:hypothetical protein n=1 Tax=Thioalkalivibrio sp. AKL10 TaxID=1158158 RepID=UPI0003729A6E|nr:hypothetical protein [Thioalkalivibrio sp. AKL10]